MVGQTALTFDAPRKVRVQDRILHVLQDGGWHSNLEFVNGYHGFYCISASQRIGDLIREGHKIDRDRNHGGVGRYRMTPDSKENQ